jgi:hypothetical protein
VSGLKQSPPGCIGWQSTWLHAKFMFSCNVVLSAFGLGMHHCFTLAALGFTGLATADFTG